LIPIEIIRNSVAKKLKDGLSPNLSYHNFHHTVRVVSNALTLAKMENIIDESDLHILEVAAWMHDIGFLKTYKNHEDAGCQFSKEWLPDFGLDHYEIEKICTLIQATKVPQKPTDTLSYILCDADLFYLGSESFFEISDRLKKEWLHYGIVKNDKEFFEKQLSFLEQHQFFTTTAKIMRNEGKEKILETLQKNSLV
jgi:HD superfamily phosphodiesterase